MKIEPTDAAQFDTRTASAARAEDLFLPSILEVVRHMARMAAEKDYQHFLATGEIPYSDPAKEGQDD